MYDFLSFVNYFFLRENLFIIFLFSVSYYQYIISLFLLSHIAFIMFLFLLIFIFSLSYSELFFHHGGIFLFYRTLLSSLYFLLHFPPIPIYSTSFVPFQITFLHPAPLIRSETASRIARPLRVPQPRYYVIGFPPFKGPSDSIDTGRIEDNSKRGFRASADAAATARLEGPIAATKDKRMVLVKESSRESANPPYSSRRLNAA